MLQYLLSSLTTSTTLKLVPLLLLPLLLSHLTSQWLRLRHIPGPFFAKITDLWRLLAVRRRKSDQEYLELHRKHGDLLRIGPNCVSICKPDLINDIYGINKGFVKSDFYSVWQNIVNGKRATSLVFTTDESLHAKIKRPIASAFSLSSLVGFEPLLDSTTDVFLSRLDELFAETGKVCDLGEWLQWYAFDVMGEMTFGRRLGFLERAEDVESIIASISANFDRCSVLGQMPWLDLVTYKNPLYLKFAKPPTNPIIAFGKRRLDERTEENTDAGDTKQRDADFLSRYLKVHDEQPELVTDTMLLALLFANINAGSDTVASVMRAIFYHLMKNPQSMDKLMTELDEASSSGDLNIPLPTWSEVQTLPYLNAVIKEALRINPALSLPMERIVPSAGIQVDSTYLRAGTIVGINPWVLHRDARIFGPLDTEKWHPERWLDADEEKTKHMEANMLSFGAGSRTCLGRHIAMLEMAKVVPAILLRYRVRLEKDNLEWRIWNSWVVRQEGVRVVLERRNQ